MNIQIIYYSKYGSTQEIAHAIGSRLGTDNISDVKELSEISGDMVVVGSGIYSEKPHPDILNLLADGDEKLRDRPVALFVVCLARELKKVGDIEIGGPVYLRKMEAALGRPPAAGMIFGGRMIPEQLEEAVRKRQEDFYKRRGIPFGKIDNMSEDEEDEFVRLIKAALKKKAVNILLIQFHWRCYEHRCHYRKHPRDRAGNRKALPEKRGPRCHFFGIRR